MLSRHAAYNSLLSRSAWSRRSCGRLRARTTRRMRKGVNSAVAKGSPPSSSKAPTNVAPLFTEACSADTHATPPIDGRYGTAVLDGPSGPSGLVGSADSAILAILAASIVPVIPATPALPAATDATDGSRKPCSDGIPVPIMAPMRGIRPFAPRLGQSHTAMPISTDAINDHTDHTTKSPRFLA